VASYLDRISLLPPRTLFSGSTRVTLYHFTAIDMPAEESYRATLFGAQRKHGIHPRRACRRLETRGDGGNDQ
jgi:hypothetical protein